MEKVAAGSDNSFSAKFRIKKSKEFRNILSEGFKSHSRNFIFYRKPNSLGFPRLGLSVAKKASSSSPKRNRMKRLLREFFRKNKTDFRSDDVVLVIKNDISSKKLAELLSEIKKLTGGGR